VGARFACRAKLQRKLSVVGAAWGLTLFSPTRLQVEGFVTNIAARAPQSKEVSGRAGYGAEQLPKRRGFRGLRR